MENEALRLARRLVEEGEKTAQFFRDLSPTLLEQQLYTDGGQWKVGQLMAHILATETGIAALIRSILAGNSGIPEDFDLNRYNEKKITELRDLPIEKAIILFLKARQETSDLVSTLTSDQLNLMGRHPYLGLAQLTDIIKLLYRHTQLHQRDIRRLQLDSDTAGTHSQI